MTFSLRPGTLEDAEVLTALALRAKAYWPYDKDFIRACADDLKVPPARAGGGLIYIGELDGKIIGYFGFGTNPNDPEMTHLFVEPELIGKGFGKKLWAEALKIASMKGWTSFNIVADPYASENFYLPMGCKKIGELESSVVPGRTLPLLKFDLLPRR